LGAQLRQRSRAGQEKTAGQQSAQPGLFRDRIGRAGEKYSRENDHRGSEEELHEGGNHPSTSTVANSRKHCELITLARPPDTLPRTIKSPSTAFIFHIGGAINRSALLRHALTTRDDMNRRAFCIAAVHSPPLP
jgi:hypothetical protein